VDDLNLVSRLWCPACLERFSQRLLPPEIGYGRKSFSDEYRFLNCYFYYFGDGVLVTPHNANIAYTLGIDSDQAVGRITPNLGTVKWPFAMIRAYLRQKFAVHRQILMPVDDVSSRWALISQWDWLACVEMARKGYSWKDLLKVMRAFPPAKNDTSANQVRAALREHVRYVKAIAAIPPIWG